ncbi:hypothetical protein T230_08850 [Tannerella sp. oral taxon BU063 isolate Cell 1/3]|uniref:Uncharacterized protein n=1 Tax=Tannerella sp. oral taxon BU063 isolate Cell 1/3 TaxID=1411022 RepID=W2CLC0_9BACT|nr:hypothetical protein T230_08850 [Tannerella sp. oral taxon BU063 isolate Cell 1/3]
MKSDGKKVSIDPLPVIAIITSQSSSRQTIQANAAAMQIHRIRKNRRRKAIWSVARIRYTKANSIKMAVNSSETWEYGAMSLPSLTVYKDDLHGVFGL